MQWTRDCPGCYHITIMMTRKRKAVADLILNNPKLSGKEAVKQVYNATTDRSQEVEASRVLMDAEVMQYMADHAKDAETGIIEIADYAKDMGKTFSKEGASYAAVAVTAYKDVLDRVHGKPTQTIHSTTVSLAFGMDLSGLPPDQA